MLTEEQSYPTKFVVHIVGGLLYYSERGRLYQSQVNCPGKWPDDAWWELELLSTSEGPAGHHLNVLVTNEEAAYQFERLCQQSAVLDPLQLFHINLKRARHQPSPGPLFEEGRSEIEEVNALVPLRELVYAEQAVTGSVTHRRCGHIAFTVYHPLMRPEMRVLTPYFAKLIGRSAIWVRLRVEHSFDHCTVLSIESEDLAKITLEAFQELEWKRFRQKMRQSTTEGAFYTGEEFLSEETGLPRTRLSTPQVLDRLLAANPGPHELELRYLAAQHLNNVFNLRFVAHPYVAFLFLLEGEHSWWFVFETYKERLATYLWPCGKSVEAVQQLFAHELIPAVATICQQQRLAYVRTATTGLVRLEHNYQAATSFTQWQHQLHTVLAR